MQMYGKACRCDDTIYRSFSRPLLHSQTLLLNSPAGHNCICLSKVAAPTQYEKFAICIAYERAVTFIPSTSI